LSNSIQILIFKKKNQEKNPICFSNGNETRFFTFLEKSPNFFLQEVMFLKPLSHLNYTLANHNAQKSTTQKNYDNKKVWINLQKKLQFSSKAFCKLLVV
jgi:hypothetical protein